MGSAKKVVSGNFGNYISGFGVSSTSIPDPTLPQRRTRRKSVDFTVGNKERNDFY